MLTHEWKPLSALKDYTFLQLDDMWQRDEIECQFVHLVNNGGIARGTVHYYRLKPS